LREETGCIISITGYHGDNARMISSRKYYRRRHGKEGQLTQSFRKIQFSEVTQFDYFVHLLERDFDT
jgi:hypothetical protein